ncbi:methionine aminopeptidase [Pseudoneobacillus sp. C159]
MGLLSAFNDWRNTRYENHLSEMREANKCPDCYGRGFLVYPASEISYLPQSFDCPGCNGSGHFNDWENPAELG